MRKCQRAVKIALASLVGAAGMSAHAEISSQLFFCDNNSHTWTVYESAQPRMFHQDIGMSGPGSFKLTMIANGFGFEGFAYTRRSAWDKWKFLAKTNKGKRQWYRVWHVAEGEQFGLLQLIKDSNACRDCTVTMTITSTNCANFPAPPDGPEF